MHILDAHGGLSEGWFTPIVIWITVLNMTVGITGARQKMRELLASMSTGKSSEIFNYNKLQIIIFTTISH